MKKLINIMLSIMMVITMLNVSLNKNGVSAAEATPAKNSITLNVDWNEGC